jgi:biotin synthase-related radical SAM superfamily protein
MKTHTDTRMPIGTPQQLRVSLGTAIVLGLTTGRLQTLPTTAYLMTYNANKCNANCSFCPQARESHSSSNMLSRITWPVFQTKVVLEAMCENFGKKKIRRVCIQALNYPDVFEHLALIVTQIRSLSNVPISVSCQPSGMGDLWRLAEAGVQRIGIPLDAATEDIFDRIKGQRAGGPYRWRKQFQMLKEAVHIFGEGNVSTHLIVGLGETEKEMVKVIHTCVDTGVLPALFAFTPVRGTKMQDMRQPSLQQYRRMQIARSLILSKACMFENMRFVQGRISDFGISKNALEKIVSGGEAFRTSGCPDCNRPYYNERPTGPVYNYPTKLTWEESEKIWEQISLS